jgi:hypothetical protein
MRSELGVPLLWTPAVLAGVAALAALAASDPPGRRLARAIGLGAAAACLGLALGGPAGPFAVSWLLVGARAGLDVEGRLALIVAASALLGGGFRRGGAASRAGAGGAAGVEPWQALLAAGLASTAVAYDAATLAAGYTALVLAAYVGALRGRAGPRGAAAFLGLAIVGEVLLVDALSELGHVAESAALEAMRVAAEAEVGPLAIVLLAAAYGLPLGIAGVRGPAVAVVALAAAALVGVLRVLPGPGRPLEEALGAALVVSIALAAAATARLVERRAERRRAPRGAPGRGGEAPPRRGASGEARLAVAERALLAPAASGATLLAVLVALYLAFHR